MGWKQQAHSDIYRIVSYTILLFLFFGSCYIDSGQRWAYAGCIFRKFGKLRRSYQSPSYWWPSKMLDLLQSLHGMLDKFIRLEWFSRMSERRWCRRSPSVISSKFATCSPLYASCLCFPLSSGKSFWLSRFCLRSHNWIGFRLVSWRFNQAVLHSIHCCRLQLYQND